MAVVTGASRGIGRAVAERLAAEGADVALLARSHPEVAGAAAAFKRCGVEASTPASSEWTLRLKHQTVG